MKKYYFNDGTSQQGPFTMEELKGKNISPETPVWYDGLADWTTAGQLEELKDMFVHTPPPFHAATTAPVEEVKPVVTPTAATPVAAAATVTTSATTAPARPAKKSTAWLSYVLALLVFGGVGYLVYQDMEKNKENKNGTITMTPATDSTGNTTMQQPTTEQPTSTMPLAGDTAKTGTTTTTTTGPATTTTTPATITTTTVTPTATQPAAVTTTKPTATKPTPAEIKAKQVEAQKLAQKKAEEEKKKLQAAQAAAAAKEKEYRNNWPKYIAFGKLDYNTKGDGIDAFNVPVFNGTNAMLDKVTVRVDYMKKDKKVVKSETILIYNIPPGTGLNGKAPESKKGNNIKVFMTGITSRKLHFCFPANNGNPGDPYFCN